MKREDDMTNGKASGMKPGGLLSREEQDRLKKTVKKNLRIIMETLGWNQKQFGKAIGYSEATVSNYLNGDNMPPLELLVGICYLAKKHGLSVSLSDLVDEKIDINKARAEGKKALFEDDDTKFSHEDFLGNYLCYFFDQRKPEKTKDDRSTREMRYGVLAVYKDNSRIFGDVKVKVKGCFFKPEELSEALDLKEKLDKLKEPNANESGNAPKNGTASTASKSAEGKTSEAEQTTIDPIDEVIKNKKLSPYEGEVSFNDRHTFIQIQSSDYGDAALMIFYAPPKKASNPYIGGMGCVASVSRGLSHCPTSQKIIITKYPLENCSNEDIAELLSIESSSISQTADAEAICEFCRKLYLESEKGYMNYFEESDRIALVQTRIDQAVRHYVETNICCVGSVLEEEDRAVYKLILEHKQIKEKTGGV